MLSRRRSKETIYKNNSEKQPSVTANYVLYYCVIYLFSLLISIVDYTIDQGWKKLWFKKKKKPKKSDFLNLNLIF